MNWRCKWFGHRWIRTFTVLTTSYGAIKSYRPIWGTIIGHDCFNWIRTCKRCDHKETDLVDMMGFTKWIPLYEAEKKLKQWKENDERDSNPRAKNN